MFCISESLFFKDNEIFSARSNGDFLFIFERTIATLVDISQSNLAGGISAIINPSGKLDKSVNYGDTGYIDFVESKIVKTTIFSKYGNKIFIFLILLYIFLIFSFNRIKNE